MIINFDLFKGFFFYNDLKFQENHKYIKIKLILLLVKLLIDINT